MYCLERGNEFHKISELQQGFVIKLQLQHTLKLQCQCEQTLLHTIFDTSNRATNQCLDALKSWPH